ncbi:hypothetical protein SESBI_18964 [Sesbania bispinosa]|nr:hypothetical protein SESBI_18964 [Sesbania bispinosa]
MPLPRNWAFHPPTDLHWLLDEDLCGGRSSQPNASMAQEHDAYQDSRYSLPFEPPNDLTLSSSPRAHLRLREAA